MNLLCASSVVAREFLLEPSHCKNSFTRCLNRVRPEVKNCSIATCDVGSRFAAGSIDSCIANGLIPDSRVSSARASWSNIHTAKSETGIAVLRFHKEQFHGHVEPTVLRDGDDGDRDSRNSHVRAAVMAVVEVRTSGWVQEVPVHASEPPR